jgi:hypothetical protein
VADYSGLLTAALGGSIPALPGALCRGVAFDELPDADAASICRRCPALPACRAWADAQPPNSLDGVIAGRRRNPSSRVSGNSRPNRQAIDSIA